MYVYVYSFYALFLDSNMGCLTLTFVTTEKLCFIITSIDIELFHFLISLQQKTFEQMILIDLQLKTEIKT